MPPLLRSRVHNLQQRAPNAIGRNQTTTRQDEPERLLRKSRRRTRRTGSEALAERLSSPDKLWKKPRQQKSITQGGTKKKGPNHLRKRPVINAQITTRKLRQHDSKQRASHSQETISAWVEKASASSKRGDQDTVIYPSSSPDISSAMTARISQIATPSSYVPTTKNESRYLPHQLSRRGIDMDRKDDSKVGDIDALIPRVLPVPEESRIRDAKEAARVFLEKMDNQDRAATNFLDSVEKLVLALDEARATAGFPVVVHEYFESMLAKCEVNNEAVLQRTVMVNVFHQHWIQEMFDWNAEGLWEKPSPAQDFVRLSDYTADEVLDKISQPKPDLSIAFRTQAFAATVKSWNPKRLLIPCGSPDGAVRHFPFLFMEVKKSNALLEDAERSNLVTASRALLNMYHWMDAADMRSEFFNDVRVFSLVFNAQQIGVRVHRMEEVEGDEESGPGLYFRFENLWKLRSYSRDSICMLVNGILYNYAAKELWKNLVKAVRRLHSHQKLPDINLDLGESEDWDRTRQQTTKRGKAKRRSQAEQGSSREKSAKTGNNKAPRPDSSQTTEEDLRTNGNEARRTGQSFLLDETHL